MVTAVATANGVHALEALYREDGDRLWRALLAFGGDPEVASDAVAEAFAQALRRGDAVTNPQAWIWKAGFRIAAGELQRRGSTIRRFPTSATSIPRSTPNCSMRWPSSRQQRAAVVLFYYVDASVRDIASRTGMSQLAVRANLSRGRKRLKQLLGDPRD